jgi:hypothetical protein
MKISMGNFQVCDVMSILFKLDKTHVKHLEGFILLPRESGDDTPPSFFMDLVPSPKVKTLEGEVVGVCFLVRNISGVEGHVGTLGWGLGGWTSNSITHTDLQKPSNKLVNV